MIADLLSEPSAGFCGFREMLLNQCVGPWESHGESVASALKKRRQMYLEWAAFGQERRGSCGVLCATSCTVAVALPSDNHFCSRCYIRSLLAALPVKLWCPRPSPEAPEEKAEEAVFPVIPVSQGLALP